MLAEVSGFEPKPTESKSVVLPLHYTPWWSGAESNCRHKDFQSSALPTELPNLAGILGFEPRISDSKSDVITISLYP